MQRALDVRAHAHLAVRRAVRIEDAHVLVREERPPRREVDLPDEVDLLAEERRSRRGIARVVGDIHAVEERLAAPPPGIRVVLRADTGRVGHELERAGRLRRLLEGARLVVRRQEDRLVGRRAREIREARRRGVEMELDGQVVDRLDAARRQHALECRERLRAGVRVDEPVERRDDVVGAESLPVLELDARSKLVCPDRCVGVRLPAERQLGKKRQTSALRG